MSAVWWRLPSAAGDRPTYLAHALALSALHGPGPWPEGGNPLPDEQPQARRKLIPDAVLDGIRTQHTRAHVSECSGTAGASELVDHLQTLVMMQPPTTTALQRLHDVAVAADRPLGIADNLGRSLRDRDLPADRLRQVGVWLAEQGTRRSAVAVGVILLGLVGDLRDRELLLLLGALEDLTLYAAVALARSQPDPDQAVFELARRVDGWGRIHTVGRLSHTDDPAIKAWLLRGGYRNRIMDEYLAHTAATVGDLASALTPNTVDEALLDGAGGILTALCRGGPAGDIRGYPAGPWVINRYLTHVGHRPPTLGRIRIVGTLREFIASPRAAALDWTAGERTRLQNVCDALTAQASWRQLVYQGLNSDDPAVFRRAIWPAETLGIPFADRTRTHLRNLPNDWNLWYSLVDGTDDIDGVLLLAAELLPLAELVTGPSLEVGAGSERPEHVLDLIVSRLDAHPGKGWPLIKVALSNSTIRNRNMALNALDAWTSEAVPDEAQVAIRDALPIEPDNRIRDRMRQLLERWAP